MKINNKIKEIAKWIKKKNKEDIKNKIDPIYSIKNGSWYANEEMFDDVEELMIAVGETFYEKGLKQFPKEIKKLQEDVDKVVTKGCLGTSANCYLIKREINKVIKKRFGEIKNA